MASISELTQRKNTSSSLQFFTHQETLKTGRLVGNFLHRVLCQKNSDLTYHYDLLLLNIPMFLSSIYKALSISCLLTVSGGDNKIIFPWDTLKLRPSFRH